ncbi:hypothetical protein Tco_0328358 [Tanacetum coccineum]
MSRANPCAVIVSEEHLVPSANKLKMTKNNQRVASDTNITDTMLRFIFGILKHHKLYKPVSLTATMPQPDANKPYTKPPTENQILGFIKTLRYDEDLKAFVATRIRQSWRAILSGIVHSANLDFTSLIWDEFEWQAVDRTTKQTKLSKIMFTRFTKLIIDHILSCNKSIPRRSDSDMYSDGQDSPLTKLTNTVKGYKYYKAKKVKSEKAKAVEEPEEQHVSPIRSGKGKCYMRSGDQEANVPSAFKKNIVPRKTKYHTLADNIVEEPVAVELAKSISIEEQRHQQRPVVEDPVVQSLLDLKKGSKASRLKSLKQSKQAVRGEGSSAAHNKYYEFENISTTDSDATQDSLRSDTDEERDDETDDSVDYDMDLSNDEPKGDDDAAGFGVFMYKKLYNTLYDSVTLDQEALDAQDAEPSFHKRTHDNQDPQ